MKPLAPYLAFALFISFQTILIAGNRDEEGLIGRMNSELCSCCPTDSSIASLILDLLENNYDFQARPESRTKPDLWTILNRSYNGRNIASRLHSTYQNSLHDHPFLTESQLILLRAAVGLAHDSTGKINDLGVVNRAMILAGDICTDRIPDSQRQRMSLFTLPFFANAAAHPPAAPPSQQRITRAFNYSDVAVSVLFPQVPTSYSASDLRTNHARLAKAVEASTTDLKKGIHAIHLHAFALTCSALVLVDFRGDDHLRWDMLENADQTTVDSFTHLASSLDRLEHLLGTYQQRTRLLAETAVPPNQDRLNLALRDSLKQPIADEITLRSKPKVDALFDISQPDTLPITLLDKLLTVIHYAPN